MNKNEFIKKLKNIKTATSVTGVKYRLINVNVTTIEFVRKNNTKSESISISELYDLYSNETFINTTIAKSYISGIVQSPAVAILNQIKDISSSDSVLEKGENDNIFSDKDEQIISVKINDETKFFLALSEIVGVDYIQSKSVGKSIDSSHIFLSNNYQDYSFKQDVIDCYINILADLISNNLFSSDSLSHHVDGIIIDHPHLNTRIVEFDEEQHFTPARKDTLKHLLNILPDNYLSSYVEICNDLNYLNDFVLKKHRVKNKLKSLPKSFIYFVKWLEQSNEKSSGYISEKKGFKFLGGRIAQRAYYDCLRDTAHLSEKNSNFDIPLRFAKKKFEDKEGIDFALISVARIKDIIIEVLKDDYKILLPNS